MVAIVVFACFIILIFQRLQSAVMASHSGQKPILIYQTYTALNIQDLIMGINLLDSKQICRHTKTHSKLIHAKKSLPL